MRKFRFFLGSTIVVLSSISLLSTTHAASLNGDSNEDTFSEKSTDSALILPTGGYLHGSMTSIDPLTGKTITYNSDTDSHATTVGAIKNKTNSSDSYYYKFNTPTNLQDSASSPSPITKSVNPLARAAYPSATPKVLAAGAHYVSDYFSGSGWRFAGYTFSAASGSGGPYLQWTSYGDSGRVGSYSDANQTAMVGSPNYALGSIVGKNQSIRQAGPSTYYTWNPAIGTNYLVANK